MDQRLTDEREFVRHDIRLPAQCRKAGEDRWTPIELENIGDGGLGFLSSSMFLPGQTVEIALTAVHQRDPMKFKVRWLMKPESEGKQASHGVQVCIDFAQQHWELVEKIRHIEAWRAIQQHLQKKTITSTEAIEQWFADHPAQS
jgi:hypothetical protein